MILIEGNSTISTTLVLLFLLITGCSSSLTKPVLETDGEEMIDIYRHALEDGETVDDKLGALASDVHREKEKSVRNDREARKDSIDTNERKNTNETREIKDKDQITARESLGQSTEYVDPSVLAANKPRGRRFKNKAYTRYNGRYYHKETGLEVTEFQCGVSRKIRSKPCSGKYGFGRNRKNSVSPADTVIVRAAGPDAIIARDQEEQKQRQVTKAGAGTDITRADVKRAQQHLIKGGFIIGTADGIAGPKTTAALKSFQVQNGLVANGQLNVATRAVLAQLFDRTVEHATVMPVHNEKYDSVEQLVAKSRIEPCQGDDLYCGYSRTPDNEIEQLFPRLENPDIMVYVTPHLATHNRVPVPGYTTAFPLYDEVHYAMPGEQVTQ